MSNRITTVSVRLGQDEKEEWQSYAEQYHDGSLSRMLRSLVTNAIYKDPQNTSIIDIEAIREVVHQSQMKLKEELTTIKTLLFDILSQKREQSIFEGKELVKTKIREILVSSDKDLQIQSVYEKVRSLPDTMEFFENSSNPWNEFFILFDEVTTELEGH